LLLDGTVTVGVGFTVIEYELGVPAQPLTVNGVTVIVARIGAFVVFVAVNATIFPVPFAANPMLILSFVQVNVALVVALVKIAVGTNALLQ
jgi:predicted lysophospholipase L1 biosynthesis ABC-type transport system permease subunit